MRLTKSMMVALLSMVSILGVSCPRPVRTDPPKRPLVRRPTVKPCPLPTSYVAAVKALLCHLHRSEVDKARAMTPRGEASWATTRLWMSAVLRQLEPRPQDATLPGLALATEPGCGERPGSTCWVLNFRHLEANDSTQAFLVERLAKGFRIQTVRWLYKVASYQKKALPGLTVLRSMNLPLAEVRLGGLEESLVAVVWKDAGERKKLLSLLETLELKCSELKITPFKQPNGSADSGDRCVRIATSYTIETPSDDNDAPPGGPGGPGGRQDVPEKINEAIILCLDEGVLDARPYPR